MANRRLARLANEPFPLSESRVTLRRSSERLCFASLRLARSPPRAQSLNTAITQRHSSSADRDRPTDRAGDATLHKEGPRPQQRCRRRLILTHRDFDFSRFFTSFFLSFPQGNPASTSSHARPTAETSVSPSPRRFPPTPTRKRSARWVTSHE